MGAESEDTSACNVLLVEDSRADARLISAYIQACKPTVTITHCHSVAEAAAHSATTYDIIISDLNLPDSQGANTIEILSVIFAGTPLVALTVDEASGIACIKAGAQDFLPKSELDRERLQRAVGFAIERARANRELEFASRHDALTSLLNRAAFDDAVENLLKAGDPVQQYYLCFFDVNDFKSINDTYGHQVGDQVLREVSHFLKTHIRASDILGRWGGDEFAAFGEVLPAAPLPRIATRVALPGVSIEANGSKGPVNLNVRVSHGTAFGNGQADYHDLTAEADSQMYAAKRRLPMRPPAPRDAKPGSVTRGDYDAANSSR